MSEHIPNPEESRDKKSMTERLREQDANRRAYEVKNAEEKQREEGPQKAHARQAGRTWAKRASVDELRQLEKASTLPPILSDPQINDRIRAAMGNGIDPRFMPDFRDG